MKVMLDTNVLISALIFNGKAGRILDGLISNPFEYDIYVSEYVDSEFKDKLYLKWPDKAEFVYQAYRRMNFVFCESTLEVLGHLRDEKDIPVLSDALYHKVDILLTGDKDFLEAGLEHPMIYSLTMMEQYMRKEKFFGS